MQCVARSENVQICVVTSDKDLYQVASDQVKILRLIPQRHPFADLRSFQVVSKPEIEETYGVPIASVPLYVALMGQFTS